ncbi:diguanylate cyclase [Thiofaba sp. EF100]|uniref:diguanylate cyclase n=1 Tax=Thiofaba sp. EF100 TaxID=3121274 RepID=UPI00322151B7
MSKHDVMVQGASEPQSGPDAGGGRLALIITADIQARDGLERICQQAGLQSLDCVTEREAVALAREHRIDVCCLAFAADDPSLASLVGGLRVELPEGAPLLLLTSTGDATEHEALFTLGITEVIPSSQPEKLLAYLLTRDAERRDPRGQHIYGKRILLVEDSRTAAHVITRMLMAHGLLVDWVKRAEEALERVRVRRYDLLITDLVLEGAMSGMALVGQLRQSGFADFSLPILAMTGFDDAARRRELFRLGVNDYVTKPVVEEELLVRARNLIIATGLAARVEAQRARLNLLEVTDPLTGLHNRRMLFSLGAKYLAMARRGGGAFSLLLLDLDWLGDINIQYGHEAGDEVLRSVAATLLKGVRESDLVTRVGDTRFALALPHCTVGDALHVSERFRAAIEGLWPFGMQVTASVGVATFSPDIDTDFDALLARACAAVDQARTEGRNRVVLAGTLLRPVVAA